eukprot:3076494-Prymnesium_polylepis.4
MFASRASALGPRPIPAHPCPSPHLAPSSDSLTTYYSTSTPQRGKPGEVPSNVPSTWTLELAARDATTAHRVLWCGLTSRGCAGSRLALTAANGALR